MKIWEKNISTNKKIEEFTVGDDTYYDQFLVSYDVIGSLAHIKMLNKIGLLEDVEYLALRAELKNIYAQIKSGEFQISDDVEDIHSMIEWLLTQKLGDTGKKIHAGRSRNDQVLVDLHLMFRDEIQEISQLIKVFFEHLFLIRMKILIDYF